MARYADAVGLLLRFAVACQGAGLGVSQAKAYLGAVVVWLFAQDAAQAWAVYQARARPRTAPLCCGIPVQAPASASKSPRCSTSAVRMAISAFPWVVAGSCMPVHSCSSGRS